MPVYPGAHNVHRPHRALDPHTARPRAVNAPARERVATRPRRAARSTRRTDPIWPRCVRTGFPHPTRRLRVRAPRGRAPSALTLVRVERENEREDEREVWTYTEERAAEAAQSPDLL